MQSELWDINSESPDIKLQSPVLRKKVKTVYISWFCFCWIFSTNFNTLLTAHYENNYLLIRIGLSHHPVIHKMNVSYHLWKCFHFLHRCEFRLFTWFCQTHRDPILLHLWVKGRRAARLHSTRGSNPAHMSRSLPGCNVHHKLRPW